MTALRRSECHLYLSYVGSSWATCISSYSADLGSFVQDSTEAKNRATLISSSLSHSRLHEFSFSPWRIFLSSVSVCCRPSHSSGSLGFHPLVIHPVFLLYPACLGGCLFGWVAWPFDFVSPQGPLFLSLRSAASHVSPRLLVPAWNQCLRFLVAGTREKSDSIVSLGI